MNKNFEQELPEGYKEVYNINAKDTKTAVIFTVLSVVPLVIFLPIALILIDYNGGFSKHELIYYSLSMFVTAIILIAYVVLHELTHGIVYKLFTKQKLTFGLTLTCAYCGVPNVYVYRKTAICALIMPFAVFSVIFTVATVALFFVDSLLFLCSVFILALHLGGCVGDLYDLILYLFKFKDKTTLMRDTGPEQTFYQKV